MPFLFPLLAGYGLARWAGLNSSTLSIIVRFVCLPLVLFSSIAGRLSFELFLKLSLTGAAVALAGYLLFTFGNRLLRVQMDNSVSLPNVGFFTIPFLALSMGGSGLGTASAFLIGVLITVFVIQIIKSGDFTAIIKEPWLYATVLGIIFIFIPFNMSLVYQTIDPVVDASFVLFLVYLGAFLFPMTGYKDAEAYVTVFFRLVCGFLVGAIAINVLSLSSVIAQAVMFSALAPPCAMNMMFNSNSNQGDQSAAKVGVLVSVILMAVILFTGWKPWAVF